jgi:urea transport system permease protein
MFMDEFWTNRMAKYLVYGMLGVAISLSWGYAGILNLGQGLFFGAGAYMIAMSLKLASAPGEIPSFMLGSADPGATTELCCITPGSFLWVPFESIWFGLAMALLVPLVLAYLLGAIVFKKGVSGVFVSIITLAMVLLFRLLVIDAQPLTGGFNGLTGLAWLTVLGIEFDAYSLQTYYLVAASLVFTLFATRWLVNSRAGLVQQAIRDDQNRAKYLGFDVSAYQIFFFCVSALIAGFAGLLYVITSEFVSPTFMDLTFSISMVIWAAVGGRASLLGACIGAIMINVFGAVVSESEIFVEAWQAILGLIFVLVVLFLPRGVAGLASDLSDRFLVKKPVLLEERVDSNVQPAIVGREKTE